MRLLIGRDRMVGQWMGDQMGCTFVEPYGAIGVMDDEGVLCGSWLLNGFNGANADLTIYGPRCLTRRTIRACYAHMFIDHKLTRATGRTRRDNTLMRELLPRLGFKLECVAKRYYGPRKRDDAFVFVMFPQDAKKWLQRR